MRLTSIDSCCCGVLSIDAMIEPARSITPGRHRRRRAGGRHAHEHRWKTSWRTNEGIISRWRRSKLGRTQMLHQAHRSPKLRRQSTFQSLISGHRYRTGEENQWKRLVSSSEWIRPCILAHRRTGGRRWVTSLAFAGGKANSLLVRQPASENKQPFPTGVFEVCGICRLSI